MKRMIALLMILCMAMPATVGCAATDEYTKWTTSFFGTFDTVITIMGYTKEQAAFEQVVTEARERFTRYHQAFDAYSEYEGLNNLYVLNRDGGTAPVAVEPELMALILYIRDLQPLTQGMVNIAMGPVLNLWHEYRLDGEADPLAAELPPMKRLQSAAEHTDFDKVIIDETAGTIFFEDPKMRLDIGAVAKGYATEEVAQWMLTSEMPSFLISAGGNVRAGEKPLDGRERWGVTIQNPNGLVLAAGEDGLDIFFVKDTSVVTSGDYQRYYVVDDVRYHHIISPETLMPASYYRSVTVVCQDSGWADMLSTALFLMPPEEGRAYADSLDGVEVLWMLNDGNDTLVMTDGLKTMSKNEGASSRDVWQMP